jgi:transposase
MAAGDVARVTGATPLAVVAWQQRKHVDALADVGLIRLNECRNDAAEKAASDLAARVGMDSDMVAQWRSRRAPASLLPTEPRPGRPPNLPREFLAELVGLLARGARWHGYATDDWSSRRLAELIQRTYGVHYTDFLASQLLRRNGVPWQSLHELQRLDAAYRAATTRRSATGEAEHAA